MNLKFFFYFGHFKKRIVFFLSNWHRLTLWNKLFTWCVVAGIVGAFIGGLRNRLRRPRPLDFVLFVFVVFELVVPVALPVPLPFLPLYLVLLVLFLNLLRRSSVLPYALRLLQSASCFVLLLVCSKQSLHNCCFSPMDFHSNASVQLHRAHFKFSYSGDIFISSSFHTKSE